MRGYKYVYVNYILHLTLQIRRKYSNIVDSDLIQKILHHLEAHFSNSNSLSTNRIITAPGIADEIHRGVGLSV